MEILVFKSQRRVTVAAFHKAGPYRKSRPGTLAILHGGEFDTFVIKSSPDNRNKLRCKSRKPCISHALSCTGFSCSLNVKAVPATDCRTGTFIDHILEH